ncbi:MAG: P1 family peptidase [Pseudomonadota bacterium]
MTPGPRNLITDVPGLLVGNAQDRYLKSGVTVLTSQTPFTASVHVMGGAPGTRETDLLAPDKSVSLVDALVLSGGSAFGLDACSGVADVLRSRKQGYRVGSTVIPIVPGAIIFDLINGGDKNWDKNPYPALGANALNAASADFELGSFGAGTGALCAMVKGGLGSASLRLDNGMTVGAVVATNPNGSVTTPGDRHFWAAPFELGAEFGGLGPDNATGLGLSTHSRKRDAMKAAEDDRANTTIAIVATDAALSKTQCLRVATAAHDGIGRAIVPAHTPSDGDLVFAVSTGAGSPSEESKEVARIGHAASLCLSRAIARSAYCATPEYGDIVPCWTDLNAAP